MKRYHQDLALIAKRGKEYRRFLNRTGASCEADKVEPGRFRKRHPLDCGRTQCGLCHSEKRFNRPSHSDRREALRACEELKLAGVQR